MAPIGHDYPGTASLGELYRRSRSAVLRRYRRLQETEWGVPLAILGAAAAFWLLYWLTSLLHSGSYSPVSALISIYGTGAAVLITIVAIAAAAWMTIVRLGYSDAFLDSSDPGNSPD